MQDQTTYGVFMHSNGAHGGFVVREIRNGYAPAPYRSDDAVKVYKQRNAAERYADRLTFAGVAR